MNGVSDMAEIELLSYEACPYAQRTSMALIEDAAPPTVTPLRTRHI